MQGGVGDPLAPAVCLQTPGILLVVRVTMATSQDFARPQRQYWTAQVHVSTKNFSKNLI